MSGAQNGVMGDADEPTSLPVTEVPEEVVTEEKKMAQYSTSAEYKRLEDFMKARIQFYQNFMPDGRSVKDINLQDWELAQGWKVANIVITEFQGVIDAYERAREAVEGAGRES
jgi:hypothetical protein